MQQDRTSLILGLLLVAVGGGWLLGSLGFIRSVDRAWSLGLAVVEVPVLVLAAGILLIAARSEAIPMPRWIHKG